MISFFRRALSSWIVLGLLGLVMLAFIVTGVGAPTGLEGGGGSAPGGSIAKIGSEQLGSNDAAQRIQLAQQNLQQEKPEVDMATFVREGGADDIVRQLISARALEVWARSQEVGTSKRLVDGNIASIPAFRGPTGQFDEGAYRAMLAQRRLTDAQVRRDIEGDAIRRQLLVPIVGGNRVPGTLVAPYASLMLELRKGEIGLVPSALMVTDKEPTQADLDGWYKRNLARYTMPERRVIRYALISKDQLKTAVDPTDAEITAFYNANANIYGASETRSFSQVILPDEATAKAFSAKIAAGTSFPEAAKVAGFAPSDTALGFQTRAQIGQLASAAIANAAFVAKRGAVTAPLKSTLGWHILHVDDVKQAIGRPLSAVRTEIAESLRKQKTDEAIADLISKMEDQIADGDSFDDVVKAHVLTALATPPMLASGQAPSQPQWQVPNELRPLLKTAFDVTIDDDPTVENIGNGTFHALLKVGEILPSAPIPLAQIRQDVARDFATNRAFERARAVAKAIVAKTDAGTPFARAISEAGLKLPAPQAAGGRQIDLAQAQTQVPPPLALMFSLMPGNTRMLEAPNKQGWYLVHLNSVEKGDLAKAPGLLEATRNEFSGMMTQELIQQFALAVEQTVGVKRNDAAIAKLKGELSGADKQ